ncbi:MAG: carbohydrate ABC transporter permease [Candidatus Caldatribacterium sp.]|uniref:carbohydrate ABC transporter permease n=1 Tax=Candidatus Caldatribacterium sp. TaxID=2282143 RepID=UPI00299AE307|nr:carbohydrate ABC transporter permease [Candidatus Caldatribacterium sp.]MCX7731069.1 carbohydrate ABC transporter permease [Candidatus Caldatribacterium sp.]MDW8081281.1 carbohydrate ABC transporter permease [Candidatus Calescibacterium sp.]
MKRKTRWARWKWTVYAAIPTIIIILPLYFIAIGGFQSVSEIFHKPPHLFPPNPTLVYYKDALLTLSSYLKNSFIIALGVLSVTLAVALPSAFALAKFQFVLRRPAALLLAFTQVLPATAIIIPLFLIFSRIGLINDYLGVILGISVFTIPFATIVLSAYIQAIPSGLMEAALIDGAGFFRIFVSIIIPLASPAIATASILTLIMAWGDFIFALSFLKERALQPMSIGLYHFIGQYGIQWNKLMAGSMIFAIPPLLVALFAGKAIVAGLTAGAFKE